VDTTLCKPSAYGSQRRPVTGHATLPEDWAVSPAIQSISLPLLTLPDPKFVSIPSGSYIHIYLLQWTKISGSTYSWVLLLSPTASAPSLISRLQPNQSLRSKTHLRKNQLHLSGNKVDVPPPRTRHHYSNAIPTSAAHPYRIEESTRQDASSITSRS
jgi:hypothetical protein